MTKKWIMMTTLRVDNINKTVYNKNNNLWRN